ncbi:unnamed protein product [[Candida] boidinii]|nr:unnamed protein product [[Candida] boidinii]
MSRQEQTLDRIREVRVPVWIWGRQPDALWAGLASKRVPVISHRLHAKSERAENSSAENETKRNEMKQNEQTP